MHQPLPHCRNSFVRTFHISAPLFNGARVQARQSVSGTARQQSGCRYRALSVRNSKQTCRLEVRSSSNPVLPNALLVTVGALAGEEFRAISAHCGIRALTKHHLLQGGMQRRERTRRKSCRMSRKATSATRRKSIHWPLRASGKKSEKKNHESDPNLPVKPCRSPLNRTPKKILRINKKEFDDEIGKFDEEDVQAFRGRMSGGPCACCCARSSYQCLCSLCMVTS